MRDSAVVAGLIRGKCACKYREGAGGAEDPVYVTVVGQNARHIFAMHAFTKERWDGGL